jgi:hypothetical protein
MIFCDNPNCPGGAISYPVTTEDDEMIPVTCEGCGNVWYEPNDRYIDRRCRDMREDYYDRF